MFKNVSSEERVPPIKKDSVRERKWDRETPDSVRNPRCNVKSLHSLRFKLDSELF